MSEPSQSELGVLRRIYRDSARQLGAIVGSSDFQRGKAGRLLAQVDAISKRLGFESDRWVALTTRRTMARSAAEAQAQVGAIFAAAGKELPEVTGDFLRVNAGAVSVMASTVAQDLAAANKRLADAGRRVIRVTAQKVLADPAITETLAKGLVAGGSLNDIANSLRNRLGAGAQELLDSGRYTADELRDLVDFEAGVIQAGKRRMDIGEYCEIVASFQLRQAVVEAQKRQLQQIGDELGDPDTFDLVVVVGRISGDECDFYVNKVFSISGRSSDYPACDQMPGGGPPFHPHCTHTIAPWIAAFRTARERERAVINPKLLDISIAEAATLYGGPDRNLAARRAAPDSARAE